MIQFGAWFYFWFTVSALILAWWAWFTVRTYRNLPGQAWKRQQRIEREAFASAQRNPRFTLENARKAFSGVTNSHARR